MRKEIFTLGKIQTGKDKFYRHECTIFLEDVDIEKVLVFSKISSLQKTRNCDKYKVKP